MSFAVPKSGTLSTVADEWHQPDAFRRYRVIGSDGGMRGYAGGVERKQQLLAHEGALLGVPW